MKSEEKSKLSYNPLSPTNQAEECEKYVEALEWALNNKARIKNIAISGPYGSGKSSVIETFMQKQQNTKTKNKFLNISLATFRDNEKQVANDTVKETDLQRLIELSILQQLFYHEEDDKIPDSRFKKIKSQKRWYLILLTACICAYTATIIFLFFPNTLDTLFNIKTVSFPHCVKYIFSALFLAGSCCFGYKFIKTISNISIKKFSMQSAEIEIDENISKSILNSHLDEIIYFFEATKYNVVIIEDLDRFEQADIFTKLREINLLINSSKKIKDKVVFIYAIRDDMFLDKDRAKFFDFMIPIIPVINFSNSGEKLRKIIKDNKYTISDELIDDLSLFIDDMRLLYNIMNEFHIYSNKLSQNLDKSKLLAMIVYKNIYPNDFTKLSANIGDLYTIISKKYSYVEQEIEKNKNCILQLKENIKTAEKEHLTNIKELRTIYICKVVEKIGKDFIAFKINNEQKTISDYTTDEYFEIIKQGNIFYYYTNNYNNNYYTKNSDSENISFSEIEKKVDSNRTYAEREAIIKNKTIPALKKEIEEINAKKELIQKRKLKDLLSKNDISVKTELGTKADKKIELIDILLRNGYIDEDYLDYISIFHEGSITKNDHHFLMNVKMEKPTEFDYIVYKTSELINKIDQFAFEKEYVFNYMLADELINQTGENVKKAIFFTQLANEQETTIDFIDLYLPRTQHKELFIKLLCSQWTNMWNYIQTKSSFTDEKKETYFTAIIQYADIETILAIFQKNDYYIANYANFFSIRTEENKKEEIVKKLDIKFKVLDDHVSEPVLSFLYQNTLYDINITMLKAVTPKTISITNDFYRKNYSFIQSSDLQPLIKYIEANINDYVKSILLQLENNKQEDVNCFTLLLNNQNLDILSKEQLIEKQNTIIQDITTIKDISIWDILFKHSKIKPSWQNVLSTFEKNENSFTDKLIEYLNKMDNAKALSKNEMPKDKNEDGSDKYAKINVTIIHSDVISIESYKLLTKASPWWYEDFETEKLTEEKIEILIENIVISSTIESYKYLKTNFDGTNIQLFKRYPDKFKDILPNLKFDSSDLELIIQSTKLSKEQKYNCIATVTDNVIVSSDKISQFIVSELLENPTYTVHDSFIIALLNKKSINTDSRIQLFHKNTQVLDTTQLETFLKSLGEKYDQIPDKSQKAKLSKTTTNEILLEDLKQKHYISSYSLKSENFQVNHFRDGKKTGI